MPEVVVKYKGQKALKALQDLAKAFDMEIEQPAISSKEHIVDKRTDLSITFAKDPDFTALAGIWKDRDITQEELRKKAWGNRL